MLGELLGTEETAYTGESGTVAVLKDLEMILKDSLPIEKEQLKTLFSSDEFKALVKDSLEQQWTVRPKELTDSDQINRLYDKLNDQIDRMENAMKAAGQTNNEFAQTAAEIRGNIEFMNQINEAYTYAQIPLKMSGQNASGELYVYTNKKSLAEGGDGDLTAFLHLDMDNLGSTDVSVRMHGKQVSTNFYLDSDEAFALVERNVPVLEDRLRKKGYDCSVTVINEEKHVNFVDDFLRKDLPPTGQLHRYSFDMRA
jgi:flagellar hook-length control protein FliK